MAQLTSREAAEQLGCHKGTINKWAREGRIPSVVAADGSFRFDASSLEGLTFRMWLPDAPLERFWRHVTKTDDCWRWTGKVDGKGYGTFWFDGRNVGAHRWGYEQLAGAIPEGLILDHTCHTRVAAECLVVSECMHRRCVNPEHLEPVTHQENLLRGNTLQAMNAAKTHCLRDHAFTPENTGVDGRGRRFCRTCKYNRGAEYRRRKRQVTRAA